MAPVATMNRKRLRPSRTASRSRRTSCPSASRGTPESRTAGTQEAVAHVVGHVLHRHAGPVAHVVHHVAPCAGLRLRGPGAPHDPRRASWPQPSRVRPWRGHARGAPHAPSLACLTCGCAVMAVMAGVGMRRQRRARTRAWASARHGSDSRTRRCAAHVLDTELSLVEMDRCAARDVVDICMMDAGKLQQLAAHSLRAQARYEPSDFNVD
jgi:hypothetical protein